MLYEDLEKVYLNLNQVFIQKTQMEQLNIVHLVLVYFSFHLDLVTLKVAVLESLSIRL